MFCHVQPYTLGTMEETHVNLKTPTQSFSKIHIHFLVEIVLTKVC